MSDSCDPLDCVAHQACLSMGFPRQEYCSGLPFPSPEDLPNPGIESASPTWQAGSLPTEPPRNDLIQPNFICKDPISKYGHILILDSNIWTSPVLLPGKSHGRRSLVGCSPWDCWVGHDWETSLSLFTFMHWRRKWHPTPVFLPGESQGRGSLVGCHLWDRTESDTTEVT